MVDGTSGSGVGLEQDADVQLRWMFGSNWFLLKGRHVEGTPLFSVLLGGWGHWWH